MEKSSILFSTNTSIDDRELAMNSMDIRQSMEGDKYLELPILIGRNKKFVFRSIREKNMVKSSELGQQTFILCREEHYAQSCGSGYSPLCDKLF